MIRCAIILLSVISIYCVAATEIRAVDDVVLAEVGDWKLKQSDFDRIISYYDEEKRMLIKAGPAKQARLLKHLAETRVFAELARSEDFDKRTDIREQLELQANDLLAKIFLSEKLDEAMAQAGFTEKELRLYYKTHQEEFMTPDQELRPFESVRANIEEKLRAEMRTNMVKSLINNGVKEAGAHIYYERLNN